MTFQPGVNGLTRGKILGCRLKAHIAYGRNINGMSEHLREVRDAFCSSEMAAGKRIEDDKVFFYFTKNVTLDEHIF